MTTYFFFSVHVFLLLLKIYIETLNKMTKKETDCFRLEVTLLSVRTLNMAKNGS